ncbi:hypothetical protein KHA94_15575 [Bacillus sp. FJAT-49705]|uniref:NodB homology domain-containing protein n=1 Tax=Cytobacillus citreus TaxID=2833586 RepID=A0ABS5NVX2_9BACI|nr:hypothetical protein [Cytobacillus citreus]MBS4191609.1 hypothetical protein [Cytobacillus citreus]
MARIGLFFDRQAEFDCWFNQNNIFERYLIEVLEHARVPYQLIDDISAFKTVDLLIVGFSNEDKDTKKALMKYATSGGIVISYGGLDFLCQDLGCTKMSTMDTGYADLMKYLDQENPLRFLQAHPWKNISSDAVRVYGELKSDTQQAAALLQIPMGDGHFDRWAVNIPSTIVSLQQGTKPIIEDGIPASDGTANIDEGILKADDGFELDWGVDREFTETGMPYFSIPYADLWREAIIGHLIRRALDKGLTLPVIEYWPAEVNHVALISFDSDMNINQAAEVTLQVLKEEDVQTTWCMIAPGFSSEIYKKAKANGHELAFHFNALDAEEGVWSETAFNEQLEWLKKEIGEKNLTSNKNHYTRFEGWGELFQWCEKNGIKADQTRGPSKKGNVGFLFGTCHPFFPISMSDEKNRFYDVLEIGFLTQDMNHPSLADTTIIEPFLEKVKRVNGVGHFLFHQYHVYHLPEVKNALVQFIREAKSKGFTFWTSKQINDWERARRQLTIFISGGLKVISDIEMPDIKVWIPASDIDSEDELVYKFGLAGKRKILSVQLNKVGL